MTHDVEKHRNRTGLSLYIDTHILDSSAHEVVVLRQFRAEGWISLLRTDAMDIELASAPPEKWEALTEASADYAESLGPAILDHSRLDFSVIASTEDDDRFTEVFAILFPGADRATCRPNHIRDAMHVSTAIRYGGHGFVTNERKLLNKADRISDEYHGFRLWTPAQALREAADRAGRLRELHRLRPERGELPLWPADGELAAILNG